MAELILASASPRRAELLARVELDPTVVPANIDEAVLPGEHARAYVERLARDKARAVAAHHPGSVVLAADTAVVLDDVVLGKPADRADGRRMLGSLSGRSHEVLTAAAVVDPAGRLLSHTATAAVTFAAASAAELDWYLDTGEPMDKAGAYALQGIGAFLIEHIEGDPTTVIGLPLRATLDLLAAAGLDLPGRDGSTPGRMSR